MEEQDAQRERRHVASADGGVGLQAVAAREKRDGHGHEAGEHEAHQVTTERWRKAGVQENDAECQSAETRVRQAIRRERKPPQYD